MLSGARHPVPIPLRHLFGLVGVLGALVLLLPTCETSRRGRLSQPIELYLLADRASDTCSVPYADETGTLTGFVSSEPDFVITRLEELILEVRQLPVFQGGKVVGKQPHRFATLHLPRRDRKALAAFSERAVGRVLLIRMGGHPLSTTFMTEPLADDAAFVISGLADERMLAAIRQLQASYEGQVTPPPQK